MECLLTLGTGGAAVAGECRPHSVRTSSRDEVAVRSHRRVSVRRPECCRSMNRWNLQVRVVPGRAQGSLTLVTARSVNLRLWGRLGNAGLVWRAKAFLSHGKHGGQHRNAHDDQEGQFQVIANDRHVAEAVADQGDPRPPQHAADHVEAGKRPVGHVAHTGHHGAEGPHDGHEAGQHDGLRSMSIEEGNGAVPMFSLQNPPVGALEQRRTRAASQEITGLVPSDGGNDHHQDQHPDVGVERQPGQSPRSRSSGGEQQRVAGEKEPNEQAGLGEDDGGDADQPEGIDQMAGREIHQCGSGPFACTISDDHVTMAGRASSSATNESVSTFVPDRARPDALAPSPTGSTPPVGSGGRGWRRHARRAEPA
ncbi:hypothetical protein BN381_350047 [Candidatus Microthrix parvicella RN1]|uniref:Uncharacterized protein n=1 Tax=Candidatus Neomicrothrix parvicella RN1 TaxID=1229780 RepID=R4Z630_9ACTN|nr:hypothetical protein BN381_350047 [Candidatus Microthrix parvicella RN1]